MPPTFVPEGREPSGPPTQTPTFTGRHRAAPLQEKMGHRSWGVLNGSGSLALTVLLVLVLVLSTAVLVLERLTITEYIVDRRVENRFVHYESFE